MSVMRTVSAGDTLRSVFTYSPDGKDVQVKDEEGFWFRYRIATDAQDRIQSVDIHQGREGAYPIRFPSFDSVLPCRA